MQVSSIMSRDVHFITPEATVREAAEKMRAFDIGSLPVCRGSELVGIITDRDITVRVAAVGLPSTEVNVCDAMSGNVVSCHENDDLSDAARVMEDMQVRRLPVIDDDNNLVGLISLADIAERTGDQKLMARVLEHVCEPHMQMYIG
jgi:CBS domain-containing protein